MERKELYHLTNDIGMKYLDIVKDWQIVGLEGDFNDSGFLHPIVLRKGWPNEKER